MEIKEFINRTEAPLEYLRKFVMSAAANIDAEYARTDNTWMSCFVSILTVIKGRMMLQRNKLEEALSPEGYRAAMGKLAMLERRVEELKTQYPGRELDPPEEAKEELLKAANIF